MRRPWRIAAIILFAGALLVGGLSGGRLLALSDEARESLRLYSTLISLAHDHYGADLSYRDLVYASIQGMLRTLDPHTSFLSPEAYASMREKQQSTYSGLGLLVGIRNGQLTVISPIEGSPAARLGVRTGDIISLIEGEPTEKMTLDEAVQKLKGPKDTKVHVTLLRRGLENALELTVTRAEIPQTTVRYAYLIAPETGYLLISDFARGTGDEVAKALDRMRASGMKRLLLDLRNNGGGLLDQAIDVSDQFLPKGSKIVETRGRSRDSFQEYTAAGSHPQLGLPVVVLVNNGTASASEIVTGAIQDHDVGMILGTATWGKGLVQTVYTLSYGAGLALTTAKYYTPSGRLIQRDYSSFLDYFYNRPESTTDQPESPDKKPPAKPPGPAYRTDLGRVVYGGGGISPDITVQPAEVPPFLQYLFAHNAFFDFAVEYENRRPLPGRDWKPGPDLIGEFRAWLTGKSLGTAEDQDKAFADASTRDFVVRQIQAELFNSAFGLEAGHKILSGNDNQIQAALQAFGKAADLLTARQERKPGKPAQAATTTR